ncbi:hypothetical protein ACO0LD_06785 [Undibacterium sp. Ji83W]|uniref:hypothetical protein n=1 Tax=Undibacterium sp. Ji83W TaxID=3413043 RepID=UPI003BF0EFA9
MLGALFRTTSPSASHQASCISTGTGKGLGLTFIHFRPGGRLRAADRSFGAIQSNGALMGETYKKPATEAEKKVFFGIEDI